MELEFDDDKSCGTRGFDTRPSHHTARGNTTRRDSRRPSNCRAADTSSTGLDIEDLFSVVQQSSNTQIPIHEFTARSSTTGVRGT
ncbi:hypothetical protein BJI47_19015 [Rhodococcus sp. 1168]|nr:hypothetical protein BJI47_19015 [Rhodococcus sp. 1168]